MHKLAEYEDLGYLKVLSRMIIHDFNNVMGAIYGALSIIDFEIKENENVPVSEIKEEIDEINLASKKSFRLINILHNHIKKVPFDKNEVDIKTLINNLITEIIENLEENIKINLECKTETTKIQCNAPIIKILFYNTIVNSIEAINAKYTRGEKVSGTIDIIMVSENNKLVIKINDTGRKFVSGTGANYFSPLYTTKTTESGVGLSMVSTIARIHAGLVKICGDDEPCKIKISLPIQD